MIYISHRGNLNGPNPERENSPDYIREAMDAGFEVEVDVFWDGKYYLGHDAPKYPVEAAFLRNPKLWCHAKTIAALTEMIMVGGIHCFGHNEDDAVLTSSRFLWTYPGKPTLERSIVVMPEWFGSPIEGAYGVCTDYPIDYKNGKRQ